MAADGLLGRVARGATNLAGYVTPYPGLKPPGLLDVFNRVWSSMPNLSPFAREDSAVSPSYRKHPMRSSRAQSLPVRVSWIDTWLGSLQVEAPFLSWIQDEDNQRGFRGVIEEGVTSALVDLEEYDYSNVRTVYECDKSRPGQTLRLILKSPSLEGEDLIYNLRTLCDMDVPLSVQQELMRLGTQALGSPISVMPTYLMTFFKDPYNPDASLDVRTVSRIEITSDQNGIWNLCAKINLVITKELLSGDKADKSKEEDRRFIRLHVNYHLSSIGRPQKEPLKREGSFLKWSLEEDQRPDILAHSCVLKDRREETAEGLKKTLRIESSIEV